MNKRTLAVLTATAIIALSVTGCTSTPVETPVPSDPGPPAAAAVVVSATAVTVLADNESELSSYSYFEPSALETITGLTRFFGYAPIVTEQDNLTNLPKATIRNWDGFELWEFPDVTADFPDQNSFRVVVKSASVGDVTISAAGGIAVGMDEIEASPRAYRHWTDTGSSEPIDFYLYDETPVELEGVADYEPAAISVTAWVQGKDRTVQRIDAPSRNFGA